ADVVTLIAATERRHRDAGIPLVTMSMGSLGAITRIGGGVFGSAATFATVGPASAPGQLPAAGVRAALDLLGGESPAPDGSAQPYRRRTSFRRSLVATSAIVFCAFLITMPGSLILRSTSISNTTWVVPSPLSVRV